VAVAAALHASRTGELAVEPAGFAGATQRAQGTGGYGAAGGLSFPHRALWSHAWLAFLCDVGLRTCLDEGAVCDAAAALQACRSVHATVPPRVAAAAFRLLGAAWIGELSAGGHAQLASTLAAVTDAGGGGGGAHDTAAGSAAVTAGRLVRNLRAGLRGAIATLLGPVSSAGNGGGSGSGQEHEDSSRHGGGGAATPGLTATEPASAGVTPGADTEGVPLPLLQSYLCLYPPVTAPGRPAAGGTAEGAADEAAGVIAAAAGDAGGADEEAARAADAAAAAATPACLALPLPGPLLRTVEAVRRLSELAVVPALPPSRAGAVYAFSPAATQVRSGAARDSSSNTGSNGGVGGGSDTDPLLLRYKDCLLPADAHLGWTVLPVVPPALVPPPLSLAAALRGGPGGRGAATAAGGTGGAAGANVDGAPAPMAAPGGAGGGAPAAADASTPVAVLGIASPPPRTVVLRHIRQLTGDLAMEDGTGAGAGAARAATDLDHWSYADPPAAVFTSLFRYLGGPSGWAALSPAEQGLLQSLPLIPVGSALMLPSRVFFRLSEPLAPLMAEVPRAFGAHDDLLRRLGVVDAPSRGHYIAFLAELATSVGGAPLNVNELAAVVRVVGAVARDRTGGGGAAAGPVFVPDVRSALMPAAACAFSDDDWLAAQLQAALAGTGAGDTAGDVEDGPAALTLAHPWLDATTCMALGIRPLSACVHEQWRGGSPPAPNASPELAAAAAACASVLQSAAFAVAVAGLAVAGHESQHSRTGGAAAAAAGRTAPGFEQVAADNLGVSDGGYAPLPGSQEAALAALLPSLEVDVASAASAALARLRGIRVAVVPRIDTALLVEGAAGSLQPLAREAAQHGATLTFVDEQRHTLYVAADAMPPGLDLAAAVAHAVCQLLRAPPRSRVHAGGGVGGLRASLETGAAGPSAPASAVVVQNELPVAALLRGAGGAVASTSAAAARGDAGEEDVGAAAATLAAALRIPVAGASGGPARAGVSAAAAGASSKWRGVPGAPLTALDAALAQLTPMRAYERDEVVAWDARGDSAGQRPHGAAGQRADLRYGLVLDSVGSAWGAVSRLRVQVGALPARAAADNSGVEAGAAQVREAAAAAAGGSHIRTFLSSEVYSFLATRNASQESAARLPRRPVGTTGAAVGGDGSSAASVAVAGPTAEATTAATAGPGAASADAVTEGEVVAAVDGLLRRVGLSLSSQQSAWMAEVLQLRQQLAVSDAAAAGLRADAGRLVAEVESHRSAYLCNICYTNEVDTVMIPCGHTICGTCVRELRQARCPFDRQALRGINPFFKPK
jgi:hypothetical protein